MQTGLIILDGPDGCGKTTLAEFLVKKYNGQYIHNTWSSELEKTQDENLGNCLEAAITSSSKWLVVIDRLWLSEICYAEGIRSGSNWPHLHEQLFNRIIQVKALNIFCFPSSIARGLIRFEALKNERPEMYGNIERVFKVYRSLYFGGNCRMKKPTAFLTHIRKTPLVFEKNYMLYDFEKDGIDLHKYCEREVIASVNKLQEF